MTENVTRRCPECRNLLSYTTTRSRNEADRRARLCRSCAKKGQRNPNVGREFTIEQRRQISECNRARGISRETRRKMSAAQSGRKLSAAHCRAIAESKRGAGNPNWGGGVKRQSEGRVMLLRPGHPSAHKDGYVLRARLVAEEKVGRVLGKYEVVHHVNGTVDDDRPENLMVFASNAEHMRFHRREK
jgi:hypothetical protein